MPAGANRKIFPHFSTAYRVNTTSPHKPMNTLQLTAIVALALLSPVFAQDGSREKIREPEIKPGRAAADNEKRDGERREKPNRDEMQAMLEKSRHELEEAAKNDRQDEAEQIKHRIARLESALRESGGGDGERSGKRPDAADAQARLQHLGEAIQHLHAAGMHEPAERLAEQAREMKRQLAEAHEAPRPDGERRPDAERQLAELREGMMNMQRHLQEMQKRLEELSRERK